MNSTTIKSNGIKNHFTILRNSAIAPLNVIDFETLDQALNPDTLSALNGVNVNNTLNNGESKSESKATSPSFGRREPHEISFLTTFDNLLLSHSIKDECLTCCQTLEFLTPENVVVMKAIKKSVGCYHQNYEIFHVPTRELVILIEIEDGTWSCMVPSSVQIYGPPGKSLGFIDCYSGCGSKSVFEIRNADGNSIYTVEPKFSCFGPTEYPVLCNTENKDKVAKIEVTHSLPGCFCGLKKLKISFIENLTPTKRALVIGFALLVDLVELHKNGTPI